MIESISSPANKLVKEVASLKQKKYRDQLGLFTAEGIRLVEECSQAGWPVETCIFTPSAASKPRGRAIIDMLASHNTRMVELPEEVYAKISDTEQPQGMMAVMKKRTGTIDQMVKRSEKPPLLVVIDGIQDPGNVGTIIRTANAAGSSGVILLKGSADLYAGKTVRATMGSLFHLPVVEGMTAAELIAALSGEGIGIVATSLEASDVYYSADFRSPTAIVLGNEGQGVSAELIEAAVRRLHIPLVGQAESLNVAVAAGVILYEAVRQRATL